MSLGRRITLVGAAAVGVAVVLACAAAYFATRSELFGQVDDQLRRQGVAIQQLERIAGLPFDRVRPAGAEPAQLGPQEGGPLAYVQVLRADGRRDVAGDDGAEFRVPIDDADRDVAAGRSQTLLRDANVGDVRLRVLTVPLQTGSGAVQLARPVSSIDSVLARLRWILLAVCLGGVGLAAALARLVTRRVTAPLRDVTAAAGHIAETEDLGRRITVTSDDEVGQLATRFNEMIDRLQASREALSGSVASQRQLVADASHELRTPITSLRTNLEVLLDDEGLRGDRLGAASRSRLLSDLLEQTEELGALVADVIELARGDAITDSAEGVRLDEVVADAVAQAGRHHPDLVFELDRSPAVIDGAADRLGRAVGNLLENAAKHSAAGQVIEVTTDARGVIVRDHGPGVTADDLPHLFDRFYRGATSRRLPGTGLGLAIVRQVAEGHGGRVQAVNAAGGGAEFRLRLPARAIASQGPPSLHVRSSMDLVRR